MEKDLIGKIKQLKKIQPSQEWLDLTRHNLVSQIDFEAEKAKAEFGLFNWLKGLQLQPVALAICLLLIFTAGPWLLVKAAQPSLPGEILYSVKKISEELQTTVASDKTKAQLQVEFAGRRLEELNKITEDFFTPEEKTEKTREIVNNLRNNLVGASVYAAKIDKEKAVVVAEQAKKIEENLGKTMGKTKGEAPLEIQSDLAEAEEAIKEINSQVLAVLTKDNPKITEEEATTTPDQETLIFLEELESGTITTTEEIINQIEE